MKTLSKICGWCGIEKRITEFHKRKKNGNVTSRLECKVCYRNKSKERYTKNKEKVLNRNKKYIRSRADYKVEYDKKRYNANRHEVSQRHLLSYHKRKVEDINFRIKRCLRSRIYFAVKVGKKCLSTQELIGCDIYFLRDYLESKFLSGMSWDNYGLKGWHIDHILPCACFDLTNADEQKICFHYTNLQPLWGIDNILKSNKVA